MKKRQQWSIVLAFFSVAVLLVGCIYYIQRTRESLWKQSVANVLEITNQGVNSFNVYMERTEVAFERYGKNFARYSSDEEADIRNDLVLYNNSDLKLSVIDLTHGVMYYSTGERIELTEEELAAYTGLMDKGIREPYLDELTGETVTSYYERFTFADGASGIVQNGVLRSVMADKFSISFFNNTGFSYIVNSEGTILFRPRHKNSNRTFSNIFDIAELEGNDAEDVEAFRTAIEEKKQGAVMFTIDESDYVFAFVPIESTDGWYFISIIPNSSIMEETEQILNVSQWFIVIVGAVILITASFAFIILRFRRRVSAQVAEVRYREQLFGILANNTDDVFLMLSAEDNSVEYISPNVERILGIPREEVMSDVNSLGRCIYADGHVIGTDDLPYLAQDGSSVFEGERIHRKTGERRWFTELIYRTKVDQTERLVVVISDRTEERKKETALQEAWQAANVASEAKSTFLSNMSHDIRTPMNTIVGLATLLERDAGNPEQVKEYTRKIMMSSQHLLSLINDVLDMSKIESNQITLNVEELSLSDVIEELDTIVRPQAKAKKQEFYIYTDQLKSEHLLGDHLRFNQIFINILSNAVKYTPQGGKITMTVSELPQLSANYARIRFVIKDNGIGMTKEYQESVFLPFSREENSVTNRVQGTGLGLSITKSLVEMMGGTIEVDSVPGEGSTFTVDLELRMGEEDIDPDFWKHHGITHILVVDDSEDTCKAILCAMEGTGVNMEYAISGRSAVDMVRTAFEEARDFNLVLLDWKMPDMDGLATAREIRKILPEHIPIMILTSYDYSEVEEEFLAAGIDGFIQKPFFVSKFKHVVSSITDKGEKEREKKQDRISPLKDKRILVVEDNSINAEILMELLKMKDASCEWAENGKAACDLFTASEPGHFDMVFMDVQMPVMNGYEATRAIRASSHPQAGSIPIIAMTANAFADDVKAALDSGMDAHVSKPIDMNHLEDTVQKILEERRNGASV